MAAKKLFFLDSRTTWWNAGPRLIISSGKVFKIGKDAEFRPWRKLSKWQGQWYIRVRDYWINWLTSVLRHLWASWNYFKLSAAS